MNEQFFKKQGFVDVVDAEPVVLKEDVRESEGYYEYKHYAVSVKGEVYTTKKEATLPQILSLVEGKADVVLYASDKEIKVRKEVKPNRQRRVKTHKQEEDK